MLNQKNNKGQMAIGIGILVISLIALIVCLLGIDTVDEHSKGVKVRMGEITGTMEPGIAWTGLFTDVHTYDLLTRRIDLNFVGDNFAPAKDKQAVYAQISVNYRINPEGENLIDLRSRFGDDDTIANRMQLDKIIAQGFKQAISQYTADEIQSNRNLVKQVAEEEIRKNFPNKYFTLELVTVSNFHLSKEYQAAIEKAKVAEKEALAAQKLQAIKEAEANANVAEAEGAKQVRIKQAEAESAEIKLRAEAEAYALKAKARELTPLMVENNRIDAWREGGSQVPTTVLSGSENLFMNMGAMS